MSTDLEPLALPVPAPHGELVEIGAVSSAMIRPVLSVDETLAAFAEYQRLQEGLDRRMPGAVVSIRGKRFRTRAYWRAIAVAFNLEVSCTREEILSWGDDWGYVVLYRAKAINGRGTDGDGACFAGELLLKKRDACVHDVRAMAHTRAFNRAVSNLVGFGEISAEDAEDNDSGGGEAARYNRARQGGDTPAPRPARVPPPPPPGRPAGG